MLFGLVVSRSSDQTETKGHRRERRNCDGYSHHDGHIRRSTGHYHGPHGVGYGRGPLDGSIVDAPESAAWV